MAVAPDARPAQSRDDFREALDGTQNLIGGSWQELDDPTPRSCVVQWGVEGQTFSALRTTSAAASGGIVDWLEREWERDGYAVEQTAIGPVSQLTATTGFGGATLILRVSDRGMTLQGESACQRDE